MRAGSPDVLAFQLPIRNEAHLEAFIWEAFGIRIPNTRVCPNHSTPWRAFCEAYFARSPVSVWKGSRGLAGKTFLLSFLSLIEGLTLHADVNLLGGSGAQSQLGHNYVGDFMKRPRAPRHRLEGEVTRETRFRTGAKIRALMASQTSVRGPHPQRLRLDEVDEMALDIFDAAMGQPMGKDGIESQVVASSTHQYPDGTMTQILKRAREKGWPVHEWCYRESAAGPHAWLKKAEIERKRSQISVQMWAVEYDLQEPSAEGRAIDQEAVAAMFRRDLGEFEGKVDQLVEIEGPAGGTYAHGCDWAKKVDFTVHGTLRTDLEPMRLVSCLRTQRRPWPDMAAAFDDRIKRYGGKACHDGTGLGDVVHSLLEQQAEPVILVGRGRKDLLSEYVKAIENHELEAPFIATIEAEHRYCTVDDLYGEGHTPDSIVMGALAYRAAKKHGTAVATVVPEAKLTANYGHETGGLFGRGQRKR